MPREDSSPHTFEEVDESLRRAYVLLLNEELPERFITLIEELRAITSEDAIGSAGDDP
jgi:hypothetical protein